MRLSHPISVLKKNLEKNISKIFTFGHLEVARVTGDFFSLLYFLASSKNFTRTYITCINRKKPFKKENKQRGLFKSKAICQWAKCERKTTRSKNRHTLYILPLFVEMIPFMY